jgi:hypothetical protein
MAYQGRLTDSVGSPLIGPVNLSMRIYDVIAGGSALYIEDHPNVAVDDVGAFSVKLGAGSVILGTFNSALFAGVNRYLEVVVDGEVLVPRLVMGSVPYAMQAESAPNAEAAANAAQTTADSALADATAAQSTAVAANATSIAAQSAANAAVASAASNATAITGEAIDRAAADAVHDTAISANTAANVIHDADIAGITAADAIHDADISANATALAALEARIAALEPPPPSGRFVACFDGWTVEDPATGLLWEMKTASGVNAWFNTYTWSSTGTAPDGTAYTVFLADLNTSPGFAGHTDWRLPFISELQSIMVGPGVTTVSTNVDPADPAMGTNPTGQATTCAGAPCIDPDFAAIGGPTASSDYWSASSFATNPVIAWNANFVNGSVNNINFNDKTSGNFVRAVRTGSCSP